MFTIAAVAEDRTIGNDGEIPWHYQEDIDFFTSMVEDCVMVMGRKTYQNIHGYFDEDMIVLSKSLSEDRWDYAKENTVFAGTKEKLLSYIKSVPQNQHIAVCGGESIYQFLTPYCQNMLITRVPGKYNGDAKFPKLVKDNWEYWTEYELSEDLTVKQFSRKSEKPSNFYLK